MKTARVIGVALSLMGLSAVPALAQKQPAAAGLEGGFSLSRISPDASEQSISRGPGLLAGAYVQLPLFTTIGLQIEIVYAQKNTHLTSTTDLKMDYIEVPILAKLKVIKSFYLVEGIALAFPVRAKLSSSGADLDIKDQITSPDIGMIIGGGIPVRKVAIEGRYDGGFKKVIASASAAQRSRSLSLIVRIPL